MRNDRRRATSRLAATLAGALLSRNLGARMPDAVVIPSMVWQQELPFTPQLPDLKPGLALAIGLGEQNGKPVAVAAIRFRMPDPVVRRYRGRVASAIQLIAIDIASGAVWASACIDDDAAPTTFDASAAPESPVGAPAIGGYVDVHIVELLKLPPGHARYMVFAWLDEWVSAPKGLDLAADPQRAETPVLQPANSPGATRTAPAATASVEPGLHFFPADPGKLRIAWNVERASPVVLLGYALAQRTVHWEVLARADAPHARSGVAEATLQPFLSSASPEADAFAVFAGGMVKSITPIRR